jgi:hypothetical protein
MRIRFLGKESTPGDSPTLWDTDEDQYVIQGFILDAATLAHLGDVPAGEAVILDWWLFDDRLAAFGHFHDDGRVKGSEIVTDPAVVGQCVSIRDRLWPLAIRHGDYKPA